MSRKRKRFRVTGSYMQYVDVEITAVDEDNAVDVVCMNYGVNDPDPSLEAEEVKR